MRTLDDYTAMGYSFHGTKRHDGSWLVQIPELPGCMAVGKTLEEAYDNIIEPMAQRIEANNKEYAETLTRRLREAREAKKYEKQKLAKEEKPDILLA